MERRPLGDHDLLIEVTYVGICHSDIHTVRGEWGAQHYPLVPGHEIVGVVTDVGPRVDDWDVGDRVGVGCLVNSCRTCAPCRAGNEQYCTAGPVWTYGSTDRDGSVTQGGYATHVVVDADFAIALPAALDPASAAPLLCAGITTYAPLRHWGAGPGRRVGVVGLGGLGHLAVQLASAMGAEVIVLSQSLAKQADALRLGASRHVATTDPATFTTLAGSLDLVLNTVSAPVDVDAYLGLLAVDGVLVNVGVPAEPMTLRVGSLVAGRRSYAGSLIGGIAETREMLAFCAEHQIAAQVEVIPATSINEAYERVLRSDVRFRFVIDASTFYPSAAG